MNQLQTAMGVLTSANLILNELKYSYNIQLAQVCARYRLGMGSNTCVDFETGELFD